jgi:hypothetical protein
VPRNQRMRTRRSQTRKWNSFLVFNRMSRSPPFQESWAFRVLMQKSQRIQSCRQVIAGLPFTYIPLKFLTERFAAKREHFGCCFLTIGLRLPRSTPNDLSHAWSTFAGRESRYQTNRPRLEISSLGPARTPKGDRILHGKIGDFAKSRTGGSRNIRNGI